MSPMYDFRCPGGHTTEKYSQIVRDHISCECGRKAHRLSVYPFTNKTFIWPGNIGAPEAAAYLERAVELDTMCADREAETGTEIKSRDFAYSPGTKEKFWDNRSGKPIRALDPGD